MKPLALLLVLALCGVVRADEAAAREHLADADEALAEAEEYLRELAAQDPELAKLIRESRRKAKSDTESSRGPAALESTARAAAGYLGFGPVVDIIAGGVATVTTAAGAWAVGNRRRRRREEDEEEDPDDRPRPRSSFRQQGVPEGSRDGREGGHPVRREARADSPLMSDDSLDAPANGNGNGHYGRASQRAKAVGSG